MKIVLLRYWHDGIQVYWPETLSAVEAVGIAAKLRDPEMVIIIVPINASHVSTLAISVVAL